jgi:hypothetical protein
MFEVPRSFAARGFTGQLESFFRLLASYLNIPEPGDTREDESHQEASYRTKNRYIPHFTLL